MKKVLIAMCTMAAVMSCVKTELAFEQPSEISFSPVSRYNTKAAVTGTNFTADQNFYVFANTVETTSAKYFENALFIPDDDQTGAPTNLTVYAGSPSQFWPNVTPLKFAGYTVSGNVGTVKATMSDPWGTMTITGYSQPHDFQNAQANDLMWFFDDNNANGYDKESGIITPTMKHACSWITVTVKVAANLVDTDPSTDGNQPYWTNITVKNIKFENLNTTGDVALSETAVWSNVAGPQTNVNIYNNATGTVVDATAKTIDSAVANNVIVVPQLPTTLAMTYSYTTPAGVSVTETKTGISLKYDGDNEWAAGTHYTYELTIGADEIKIAPASSPWTDYDADDSEDGVQNPTQEVK